MSDKYLNNLVKHAIDQKPVEFDTDFQSIIRDKLTAAVERKKDELAKSFFANQEDNDEEPEEDLDWEEEE